MYINGRDVNTVSGSTAMFIVLLSVLSSIEVATGCYILDCYLAGKRSEASDAGTLDSRQNVERNCPVCGPGGRGQCVSDTTCCGMTFGCLIGTPESRHCAEENLRSDQCRINGVVCGQSEDGRCVAPRVCCTNGVCVKDSNCNPSALSAVLSQYGDWL